MQGPDALLNILTIPPGATTGARIVIDGTRGAIFIYNASNQLVGSWSGTAGNDGLGNNYPAELMVQDQPHERQVQLALYQIALNSINPATTTINGCDIAMLDSTTPSATPGMVVGGPQTAGSPARNFTLFELFGQSTDATRNAYTSIMRSAAGGTVTGPGTAVLEVTDAAVGTNDAFAVFAGGISAYPFKIDTTGKFFWGSGTAAQDTDLYRNGVNALKTDGAFEVGGATKLDTTLEVVGALTADSTIAATGAVTGINVPAETMTTAQQTFTLASAVAVTGLSAALVPGTYSVEYELYWVPTGTIGSNHTHSFAFTGTATAGAFNAVSWQAQTANAVQQNMSFTTGTAFPVALVNSPTHVAFPGFTRVKARIVCSVAGTLTPTITLGTAGDNLITEPASFLKVTRIA